MIRIIIPGKPVPQSRPRFARHGNFVKTYDAAPSRDFKAWVRQCAVEARGLAGMKAPYDRDLPLDVIVTVFVERPKTAPKRVICPAKKPDLDNFLKGIFDALEGIVYTADQQIIRVTASKLFAGANGPRTEVTVMPYEG